MMESPSRSPSPHDIRRSGLIWRWERCCWTTLTYSPLVFVYGLTSWAVYVHTVLSLKWARTAWIGYASLGLGTALYLLLNWCYTTAVFTDPGSPLTRPRSNATSSHLYAHIPSHDPLGNPDLPSFTVKSTGEKRFCKKCQAKKPDRAHHCSTCRRCVLKMDHHCPWLATCVGFRNYKPFLLFLLYTSLFCWQCCFVSSTFLWSEIAEKMQFDEGLLAINMVLLSVMSGIIGLVLSGFTGWHISLACRGQTTIECLEKTRYLSPLRKSWRGIRLGPSEGGHSLQSYGQQLAQIHANALPGVTRVEEGEEHPSPVGDLESGMTAQEALRMTFGEAERARERERYENYLDDQDSEKLPNAFDLGWRRNLRLLLGESSLLWLLPVCNTQGDGWHWEPSPKWLDVREQITKAREAQWRNEELRQQHARRAPDPPHQAFDEVDERNQFITTTAGVNAVRTGRKRSIAKANQILGRDSSQYVDEDQSDDGRPGSRMSMKTLRRKSSFENQESDDEGQYHQTNGQSRSNNPRSSNGHRDGGAEWRDWD